MTGRPHCLVDLREELILPPQHTDTVADVRGLAPDTAACQYQTGPENAASPGSSAQDHDEEYRHSDHPQRGTGKDQQFDYQGKVPDLGEHGCTDAVRHQPRDGPEQMHAILRGRCHGR